MARYIKVSRRNVRAALKARSPLLCIVNGNRFAIAIQPRLIVRARRRGPRLGDATEIYVVTRNFSLARDICIADPTG